jgi:hypothetical protein
MPSKLHLRAFFVSLALLALAGFFLLRGERPGNVPAPPSDNVAPAPAPAPPPSPAAPPTPAGKGAPAGAVDPSLRAEVEAFRAAPPVQRVEAFYEKESRRVGEIDQDPELTARRLAAMAAELKPAELSWLKSAALDRKRGGDGRFFAAYLLALAPGPATAGALKEVALAPMPNLKNQGLLELERQVRAQATEGLGHARGVPEAQEALLDVVEYQSDEFVRDRAHRALYEWRTGRKLEDQDKEALRKVTEKGIR